MASAASQYATTADAAAEMDPHYAGGEHAADYYPTPESVVHIGAHATHVTVHVHAYAPPPPAPPPVPSSSVDVDVRHEPLYSYAPNPRPTTPQPPQPTPTDTDAAPSAATTPPRTTTTTTATRSVADTLGDTLAALPDGLLSPTVRAVVQQVLRRASEPSPPDDHAPAHTGVADVPATLTRLGQRGQNVAISLMMQPLSADGSTTTSLTDLFRQLNNGPDAPAAAQGVPLGDLNRHTEVVVHEPGHGLHDTCAVCQEPLEPGQVVRRVLRCGHTFHHTCLDQWLEANATCPMCMQPVVPTAVEGRAGADDGVGRTGGMPPPPPPPPPLRPPPTRASSTASATDRQGHSYSPRTTAVVQQADALLASDDEVNNGVSHSHADNDPPSRVHVRSVEVRRIPIRLWRTTAAEDTGAETSGDDRQRPTVIDRILASALDELTLDTIEEDGESGGSDDGITMV
jgi:hypothetical protein